MPFSPPASVLIIGSGVFGLSTAEALSRRPSFANTTITVVDRGSGSGEGDENDFPARDAASIDSSRIIRADYADPAYATLADEAQAFWRGTVKPADRRSDDDYIGGGGRYTESGLVVVADASDIQNADGGSGKSKKTGMYYVRESWANVQALAVQDPSLSQKLHELPDAEAIRAVVGTGGTTGDWGYLNAASGWADAAASMAWVLRRVQATGRVRFVRSKVTLLEANDAGAVTVRLDNGQTLTADLTIVATGAWTESLVAADLGEKRSLNGTLSATGQVVAYVPLASDDEHARVAGMPVVLNLSTGLFVIPPAKNSRELKVARHAYGYINPIKEAGPSTPYTHLDDPKLAIPEEGADDLRRALRQMVPLPGLADRPFARTRICWYTDTPTGDFVVDYHPDLKGLFVATGGSGHAFKFLPVIGDKVVDCIEGQRPKAFAEKWAWRTATTDAEGTPGRTTVVTEDGSRGDRPGRLLWDELAKKEVA
ncbi:hypothetical protein SEPCBS119000_001459 [Sporothrix epigloea]|uniref:FAD dependent oxidoreductase domain-containing protein n=1 Tax=Sporothrix epigloea TaxID=1892477 RepID=A0ABP0DBX6_9PEZI